jgi:hypothetical protein
MSLVSGLSDELYLWLQLSIYAPVVGLEILSPCARTCISDYIGYHKATATFDWYLLFLHYGVITRLQSY